MRRFLFVPVAAFVKADSADAIVDLVNFAILQYFIVAKRDFAETEDLLLPYALCTGISVAG